MTREILSSIRVESLVVRPSARKSSGASYLDGVTNAAPIDSTSSITNGASPPSPVYTAPNAGQAAAAPPKNSYSPFGSKPMAKIGSPKGASYLDGVTNGSPLDTPSFTNRASPPSPVYSAPNTGQAAAASAKKSFSPFGSKPKPMAKSGSPAGSSYLDGVTNAAPMDSTSSFTNGASPLSPSTPHQMLARLLRLLPRIRTPRSDPSPWPRENLPMVPRTLMELPTPHQWIVRPLSRTEYLPLAPSTPHQMQARLPRLPPSIRTPRSDPSPWRRLDLPRVPRTLMDLPTARLWTRHLPRTELLPLAPSTPHSNAGQAATGGSPSGTSYLDEVTNGSPMYSTSSFTNGASPPIPVYTPPNDGQAPTALLPRIRTPRSDPSPWRRLDLPRAPRTLMELPTTHLWTRHLSRTELLPLVPSTAHQILVRLLQLPPRSRTPPSAPSPSRRVDLSLVLPRTLMELPTPYQSADSTSSFTNRASPPSPVYTPPNAGQAAAAPSKKSYSPYGSKPMAKNGSPTGTCALAGRELQSSCSVARH
jgi:hypothetical protein